MNLMTGNICQNDKFIDTIDSDDNELDQQSVDDLMIGTDDEDTEHKKNEEELLTQKRLVSIYW
jgi:hypothetical protein